MTRDETIAVLKSRLNRTDSDIDTILVGEMQIVQNTVLEGGSFLPWFLRTTGTVTLSSGASSITPPSGFLRVAEGRPVRYLDPTASTTDAYRKVNNKAEQFVLDGFEEEGTGAPQYWFTQGTVLGVRPFADQDYTIQLRYYGRDTLLTTDVTNNWLTYAQDWFMGEVGFLVSSTYMENEKQAALFMGLAERGKDRVWRQHEAIMAQGADYSMGDD